MDEQTLTWQKQRHQHQVSFFEVPFSLNFWVCDARCHTVTPTVGQNFGLDASCNPHPPTQILDSKFYTDDKTVLERRTGGKGMKLHTREGSTEFCSI